MIKHLVPTPTYIHIHIYIHVCTGILTVWTGANLRQQPAPRVPLLCTETRSLCTLVFGVCTRLPPPPLHTYRNVTRDSVVYRMCTHTGDCVHARVSRAPPRYLADLSVPWAALRGRERDKGKARREEGGEGGAVGFEKGSGAGQK